MISEIPYSASNSVAIFFIHTRVDFLETNGFKRILIASQHSLTIFKIVLSSNPNKLAIIIKVLSLPKQ